MCKAPYHPPMLTEHHGTIRTNWTVLTGAPCSGKTTMLESLASIISTRVPDLCRSYLEEKIANGKSARAVRADQDTFLRETLVRKLNCVTSLLRASRWDSAVFDCGLPDHVAYARSMGAKVTGAMLSASRFIRYRLVLLLDPLPFVEDNVRTEDPILQRRIDQELEIVYTELGYRVQRIPALPHKVRRAVIVSHLRGLLRESK